MKFSCYFFVFVLLESNLFVLGLNFDKLGDECSSESVIYEIIDMACKTGDDLRMFRATEFDQKFYCITYKNKNAPNASNDDDYDVVNFHLSPNFTYFAYVSIY